MTDLLISTLRELRHGDADRVADLFPADRRREILQDAIRRGSPPDGARAGENPRRVFSPRRRTRVAFAPALGLLMVAAVIIATLMLGGGSSLGPQGAVGAITFHTAANGDIVATVVNPFAAQRELDEAFAAKGLHIEVDLIPVSPSLVGTVVSTSEDGSSEAIRPLLHGSCLSGGGGCRIGIEISPSFSGHGSITLGRPARAGETYESQASAFAAGEPLHCSGLLGGRASTAAGALGSRGIEAEWREDSVEGTTVHSKVLSSPPQGSYVWEAVMAAPGRAIVWAEPTPWPADPAHGSGFNQGC